MSSTVRLRPSVLAARDKANAALDNGLRLNKSGLASVEVCARRSAAVDAILTLLFNAAIDDLPAGQGEGMRSRVALVAIGGYGRRQLAPYSDVDLMILHAGGLDDQLLGFVTRLTQDLYDAGLQPGHSLREPAEAVLLARSDVVICTSLIEARLLIGSLSLFEEFKAAFRQMVQHRQKTMCRDFIAARQEERRKVGDTVFLLEPNIKRSPGGLRDIHLLRWLWYARSGEPDPNRLFLKGVISKFDHRRLMSSQKFLLAIRNEMHFAAGGANDVLNRAEQMRIAGVRGFRAREGMLPVELLMREYFRHTDHVSFLTMRLCELVSPPPVVSRVLDPVLSKSVSGDFRVGLREIAATQRGAAKLKARLSMAIRLVDLARIHGKRIAQGTWYSVYRAAPGYSSDLDEETISQFLEVLENPTDLGQALRRMRDLGILEKVLPDFSHARYLLQFNRYHKYTVDEHCIKAVEEVTRLGKRNDLAGETYRGLTRKGLLHLVLLVHDLGKGYAEDHCVRGVEIVHRIGERLGLDEGTTQVAACLVRDHLKMSHAAFRRDTSDPDFIRQFAEEVGGGEQLDMLYLLTLADLAAVGPEVLNDWKIDMLGDFYRRLKAHGGKEERRTPREQTAAFREAIWQELGEEKRKDPWFDLQFRALPRSFVTSRTPMEVASTLSRIWQLDPRAATAWGRNLADSHTVEFTAGVRQAAGRGIFSSMAGVLSSRGMSILAAETVPLEEGVVLFHYQATDTRSNGPTEESRLQEIVQALIESVDSEERPTFRALWGSKQDEESSSLTDLPIEVRIDSEISPDYLVVEVFAFDRLGLLYDLARALHELTLNIRFAKIGTHVDQVVDVFYLSERDGTKPTGETRCREIRDCLQSIVEA